MKPVRNTKTERRCKSCEGAGVITHNDTNPHGYGPDPQCDYDVRCEDCNGDGWIRFAPVDPLAVLGMARKRIYKNFPQGAMTYGRIRQKAVSPVDLP